MTEVQNFRPSRKVCFIPALFLIVVVLSMISTTFSLAQMG